MRLGDLKDFLTPYPMPRQHQYTKMCWDHDDPIRIQINSFITPIIFTITISTVKAQYKCGAGVCGGKLCCPEGFLQRMDLLIPSGIFFIHHCRLLSATYYIM